MYSRGVNKFGQMIELWHYLGFIVNQSTGAHRELFPYFTEQERAHDKFKAAPAHAIANVAAGALAVHELSLSASEPKTPVKPDLVAFATSRARGRVPN
jgi:L-lysine 6-oxidase